MAAFAILLAWLLGAVVIGRPRLRPARLLAAAAAAAAALAQQLLSPRRCSVRLVVAEDNWNPAGKCV